MGERGERREERREERTASAFASRGSEATPFVPRDRDPPPPYDGNDPEVTFKAYEKAVRLWQFETDVPPEKQGPKMMRALTGAAKLAVEDLEFEEITASGGVKTILARLREFFTPHLEVSLPRAFEQAVYGSVRQSKESFIEYVARMDRGFANLKREGVELPDGAQGYMIYRHAALSESQEQRIQTWAEGQYDRASIIKGLRRLDKVVREKVSKSFPVWEDGDAESDGEHIYVAEGDLDQVMDESTVMEALASYQEMRQALRSQKTNRGYYPQKGLKGAGKGKQKVHIEQLSFALGATGAEQWAIGPGSAPCHGSRPLPPGPALRQALRPLPPRRASS